MARAMVFIDGNNFYFKLKVLSLKMEQKNSLMRFRYDRFTQWLAQPNEMIEARYYIGAVRRQNNNPKSEKLYANQQRLIGHLQQQHVSVILGQLIQHPDKSYHEKGVDVRIAVEMIRYARENKYDRAYLVSSDTDLVPAVEEVKSFGKEVEYVGTAKGQSFGLTKTAQDTRLLRVEELEQFFEK